MHVPNIGNLSAYKETSYAYVQDRMILILEALKTVNPIISKVEKEMSSQPNRTGNGQRHNHPNFGDSNPLLFLETLCTNKK